MFRGVDGIGYSNSKKKWFIYNTSIDYEAIERNENYFPKLRREMEYTEYYDTFDDASIELGILQERYKGVFIMQIYTVTGVEEINEYLNLAMLTTLDALRASGKLTESEVKEFADAHVAQVITEAPAWGWIREMLKMQPKKHKVVVLKIVS